MDPCPEGAAQADCSPLLNAQQTQPTPTAIPTPSWQSLQRSNTHQLSISGGGYWKISRDAGELLGRACGLELELPWVEARPVGSTLTSLGARGVSSALGRPLIRATQSSLSPLRCQAVHVLDGVDPASLLVCSFLKCSFWSYGSPYM